MSQEEDRLERRKKVLKFSAPANRYYPDGRRTKRRSFSQCPNIPEDWQELPCPWAGEGSSAYRLNYGQYPLVRSFEAGRDSVVATYRLGDQLRCRFREVMSVPAPCAIAPTVFQSSSPLKFSQSPSPTVFNLASQPASKPVTSFPSPVFSQPSSTVTSTTGEGGNSLNQCLFSQPLRRDFLQEDDIYMEFSSDLPLNFGLLDTPYHGLPKAPLTFEGNNDMTCPQKLLISVTVHLRVHLSK